jgi:hyperosmotically inducible periplasmic protein
MSVLKCLAAALLVGSIVAGAGCTAQGANESKKDAGAVFDEAKAGADTAIDATRKAGSEAIDASKDIALATGAAVTDGWVTTKVKAKFADDTLLERSDISVDTTNHVVTLKGSVRSSAARSRAVEIAAGTEGVTRVVDQLVVKNM